MNWRSCYSTIAILLTAVVGWAFFQFWYPYHFFYQEQNQIFLWSWDYVEGFPDAVLLLSLRGGGYTRGLPAGRGRAGV